MEIVKKVSRRLKELKLIGDGAVGGNLVSYLRGDSYLIGLYRALASYYLIILLSYYPIIFLSYYPIILLSYYPIILLSYYPIILLSYYPIILLSYYPII